MEARYTDKRMPRLVGLEGARAILGCSHQYAHRLAERGELRGVKIGHTWIFRVAEVERVRDKRKASPSAGPVNPT